MTTQDLEKAVRDAAGNLLTAINAARAGGLDVRWPSFPGGLGVIAISETGAVKRATSAEVPVAAVPAPAVPAASFGDAKAAAPATSDKPTIQSEAH